MSLIKLPTNNNTDNNNTKKIPKVCLHKAFGGGIPGVLVLFAEPALPPSRVGTHGQAGVFTWMCSHGWVCAHAEHLTETQWFDFLKWKEDLKKSQN